MTALLIAAALLFSNSDARLAYATARTLVEAHTPRDSGSVSSRRAAEYLAAEASKTGCRARLDSFTAKSCGRDREFTNVIAEIPRAETNAGWIVFVSHFDTKRGVNCPGANDGASTSGLLVSLAAAISRASLRANVLLLWTDGEECVEAYRSDDGLQGSRHAAMALLNSGRQIKAVICADMLGDADLQIGVPLNGSANLHRAAIAAAKRIGEPQLVRTIKGLVTDDHVPFLEAGMKAVDLIDFSYGPDNAYWHAPEDTLDKLSESSLLKSGRLLCAILSELSRSRIPSRTHG